MLSCRSRFLPFPLSRHCLLDSPYSTVCASTSSSPSTSLSAPSLLLSPPLPTSTLLPSLVRPGNRRFHIPRSARRTPPLVTHLATQRSILFTVPPIVDNTRHNVLLPYSSHQFIFLIRIPSAAERVPNRETIVIDY